MMYEINSFTIYNAASGKYLATCRWEKRGQEDIDNFDFVALPFFADHWQPLVTFHELGIIRIWWVVRKSYPKSRISSKMGFGQRTFHDAGPTNHLLDSE